jgi:hypothetical protein
MPYGVKSPAVTGVAEFLHFSALLWKSSTTVGCATVTCKAGTIFPTLASLYTVWCVVPLRSLLVSFSLSLSF